MLLSLATAPAETAITLAVAKAHLRVEHDLEDALISSLIDVATAEFEGRQGSTRRAFVTQTWDMWLPWFPIERCIEMPMPPLQSVTHVKYFDLNNVETTLPLDQYETIKENLIGYIQLDYLASWPSTYERAKAVNIRFVAGYGAAAAVPQNIKHAILLRVGELYTGRGDENGFNAHPAIKRLLGPSSVVRLK